MVRFCRANNAWEVYSPSGYAIAWGFKTKAAACLWVFAQPIIFGRA